MLNERGLHFQWVLCVGWQKCKAFKTTEINQDALLKSNFLCLCVWGVFFGGGVLGATAHSFNLNFFNSYKNCTILWTALGWRVSPGCE